jgi:hypothetical protein
MKVFAGRDAFAGVVVGANPSGIRERDHDPVNELEDALLSTELDG